MATTLGSARVAFLAASEGTGQEELAHTWQAVLAKHGRPVLVASAREEITLVSRPGGVDVMAVDVPLAAADPRDYAGLMVPGGSGGQERLCVEEKALAFVRGFFGAGRAVAAVGDGPRTLMAARVLAGRRLTSVPELRHALLAAGAAWLDQPVVVCRDGPNTLVTGRGLPDLPLFCGTFTDALARAGDR